MPPVRPALAPVPLSIATLPPVVDSNPPWPGREVEIDGLRVHIRHTPGPAPCVVFVHGLGGSATNWTELAGQLADHAAGIALDLPGFGRSRPPVDRDLSLAAQARVVHRVIEELADGPVHLVGNSLGGAISLRLAAERPELVRTLTLISPAMPDLRPDPRRLSDPRLALALLPVIGWPARRALAATTPRQRAEQLLWHCFAEPRRVSDARLDRTVAEFAERATMPWTGEMLGAAAYGLVRAWLAPPGRSLWAFARRVAAPTLVIWGAADRLVSVRKAPRTAALVPRSRLLVLPHTGHVAMMERPDAVARAVLGLWETAERDQW